MTPPTPRIYKHDSADTVTLLARLESHLPYSVPVYRRIKSALEKGLTTRHAVTLASFPTSSPRSNGSGSRILGGHVRASSNTAIQHRPREEFKCFIVAYSDRSRAPETQAWLFSCLELPKHSHTHSSSCLDLVYALFREIRDSCPAAHDDDENGNGDLILVGRLHERVVEALSAKPRGHDSQHRQGAMSQKNGPWWKYVFATAGGERPSVASLPPGLTFTSVQARDMPLVLARTSIPRRARTLLQLSSVAVIGSQAQGDVGSEDADAGLVQPPIAWAFLGADNSVVSLYTDEAWRGKGLAKAVMLRLFADAQADEETRSAGKETGLQYLSHADVAADNLPSRALCETVGGRKMWSTFWTWIDLARLA